MVIFLLDHSVGYTFDDAECDAAVYPPNIGLEYANVYLSAGNHYSNSATLQNCLEYCIVYHRGPFFDRSLPQSYQRCKILQ